MLLSPVCGDFSLPLVFPGFVVSLGFVVSVGAVVVPVAGISTAGLSAVGIAATSVVAYKKKKKEGNE